MGTTADLQCRTLVGRRRQFVSAYPQCTDRAQWVMWPRLALQDVRARIPATDPTYLVRSAESRHWDTVRGRTCFSLTGEQLRESNQAASALPRPRHRSTGVRGA